MMKHIRIFGIVLLVAVLAVAVAAFACDAQKATLEKRQKAVKALENEVEARKKASSLLTQFLERLGNQPIDDVIDDLEYPATYLDYKEAQGKLAKAKVVLASAQADYDNCVELTNKVNNIVLMEACGIHEEGTPGGHKKVICPTQAGHKCIYSFYYACTPHTHAYPDGCGHTEKCDKRIHPCGCEDYTCRFVAHALRDCPLSASGIRCTVFSWGYYWTCDPHAHVYPDEPTDPNPIQPTRQPCLHFYVTGSSEAYNHRLVNCPTQNGQSCTYGSYYICRGEHTHAYPAPTQQT